jgi:MFS family permease
MKILQKKSLYQKLPFYYGWLIFGETFLLYAFMYGLRYSIGVFFVPIQEELGWTSVLTASVVTVFFCTYGITGLFVGRISAKIGIRKAILIGGLLLGCGGLVASFTSQLWHFYVAWGMIAASGSSILYTIPNMVLTRFFAKHRGKAVGWSSIGISVGQAILVPFAASLIEAQSWRMAMAILSAFVIVGVSLSGYLIFRESPEAIGLEIDGARPRPRKVGGCKGSNGKRVWTSREVRNTRDFKLILISYFFVVGGVISLLTFVVPHMRRIGVDPLLASTAFGVIGVMSALGSFVFGIISDKVGRKYTIMITAAGIALSMFFSLVIPSDITFLYLWVIVYGLAYGGIPEQYGALVVDRFHSQQDISLFGYLMFTGALGGAFFPLIGGYLTDVTGSYFLTLVFLGGGMVSALLTIMPIKETYELQ